MRLMIHSRRSVFEMQEDDPWAYFLTFVLLQSTKDNARVMGELPGSGRIDVVRRGLFSTEY